MWFGLHEHIHMTLLKERTHRSLCSLAPSSLKARNMESEEKDVASVVLEASLPRVLSTSASLSRCEDV